MKAVALFFTAALLLGLLAFSQPASAQVSVTLSPSQDVFIDEEDPNSNFVSGMTIDVGHDTAPSVITRRALLQFDTSSIPTSARVTSASVTLNCGQLEGGPFNFAWHIITSTWNESTVTWNTQPSFQATPNVTVSSGTVCNSNTYDVTSIVDSWVEGTNNGMIGVSANESLDAHILWTSTRGAAVNHPFLDVTYLTATDIALGAIIALLPIIIVLGVAGGLIIAMGVRFGLATTSLVLITLTFVVLIILLVMLTLLQAFI